MSIGEGGRTRDIITDSPLDTVKVWIARYDGGWKLITEIVSDWGNKLVTLTSPKIRIEASTHPHPQDSHGQPVKDKPRSPLPPAPAIPRETIAQGKLQSTFGDGKGTKVEETQDAQGLPVARVTSDQSKLEFLGDYTGEKITDDDYDRVAEELKIEPALLRAIALKETKGAAFDAQHRPRILYERHKFSKYSKHKFDKENPDISSRVRYTKKTKDKQGKPIPERDRYGKDDQYIRLMKAYVLDKRAALMACSWGKFQIMGFNHAACGFSSVEAFVKAISKSEVEHLQAVKGFIHVNCLQAARNLDFKAIARSFNGEKFYENNYDKDLYALYKKIKND